jgi:dihydroflavonol-4-reductase
MVAPGISRRMVSRNFGYPWSGDNSRSVLELGMTYRPLAETMNDFFQQMIDSGRFSSG